MKIKHNPPREKFKVVVMELQNLTTKIDYFVTKKSSFKGTPYFLSIDEDVITFEMPLKSCQVGHHFDILLMSTPAPYVEFRGTCKVTDIEDSKLTQKVTVKLMQYDKSDLSAFHNLFVLEQNRASKLFNSLKGYEDDN